MPTEDEVRRVMEKADASGDGQLDFLEFLALVKALKDERNSKSSILQSIGKAIDTFKSDVLAGVFKDMAE